MAFTTASLYLPSTSPTMLVATPSSSSVSACTSSLTTCLISYPHVLPPSIISRRTFIAGNRRNSHIVRMAPDEERLTRRSPLDFPVEWERSRGARRPEILPKFSPMKTPMPPPLPMDPPFPDEIEEDENEEQEQENPEEEEGEEGEEGEEVEGQ